MNLGRYRRLGLGLRVEEQWGGGRWALVMEEVYGREGAGGREEARGREGGGMREEERAREGRGIEKVKRGKGRPHVC